MCAVGLLMSRLFLGLVVGLASVDALALGGGGSDKLSRRAALLSAAPAALLLAPLASQAVGENKVGYACRGDEDCGVSAQAIRSLTARPGTGEAAGIRFAGSYIDPAFPGLPRKLILAGSNVIITGADEKGGKEWKIKGKPYGKALVLDYSTKVKGGDKEVIARYDLAKGLVFDDGVVWKKK